ncbi:MAG: type II toxin-antitoxin system VapC family toxin [Planctomycetota bacterium]
MILLDTHAWVWLVDSPDKLPPRTLQEVETQDLILVSTVSCWEISMLCAKKRIELSLPLDTWIRQTLDASQYEFVPLSVEAAKLAGSEQVEWTHHDPSDRMIVATAIDLDIPLVTADRAIQSIPGFTTVW